MMKRIEWALLLALAAGILLCAGTLEVTCDGIRDNVLRLHVLANSDDPADQQLKLKVRDRLLEAGGDLFADAGSRDEALSVVQSHLDLFREEAQNAVIEAGYAYDVAVSLENVYFTTRRYGDITLPAGEYMAVRVRIGAGKGHNWWCVMFPPLCVPAASEEGARLEDVLDDGQLSLIQGNGGEMRFWCVEKAEEWREKRRQEERRSRREMTQSGSKGKF